MIRIDANGKVTEVSMSSLPKSLSPGKPEMTTESGKAYRDSLIALGSVKADATVVHSDEWGTFTTQDAVMRLRVSLIDLGLLIPSQPLSAAYTARTEVK